MGPTDYVLIAAAVLLGLYDVFAAVYLGHEHTISRVLYDRAREYPVIAAALGGLLFHAFWPVR